MAETKAISRSATELKLVFDELHLSSTRPPANDSTSRLDAAVAIFESIPTDSQLAVLSKAIGKGIRLFRVAATVLAACKPSENVDNWITNSLRNVDSERRNWMIQIVGNEKLTRFAPIIAQLVESDDENRWCAVSAAGDLRTEDLLESLVALASTFGSEPIPMALIQSLGNFRSQRARPFLQRVFESPSDQRDLVFAAWGLARLGDESAIRCLVELLDDPDEQGDSYFHPGESLRAAQALCDVYEWPFDWDKSYVQKTKDRVRDIETSN